MEKLERLEWGHFMDCIALVAVALFSNYDSTWMDESWYGWVCLH